MQDLRDLEKKLRIRLVTGEFEILAALYLRGAMRSRDLARHTKSSVANFQIILRRMRDDQILVCVRGEDDGRVRLYDLANQVRRDIDEFLCPTEKQRSDGSTLAFRVAQFYDASSSRAA